MPAYYDRSEDTDVLFHDLAVSRDRSYKENLNKYDVIKINMQEFLSMSDTIGEMLEMLKNYLISDFKEAFDEVDLRDENNLIQVMKDVFSYTKCPFVILIDEWDCLFREYKQDKEAQKKYLDFLRAWLKDQDYVAMAYMTGILADKEIRISFRIEYVYRIFDDEPERNGRVFWFYRERSETALREIQTADFEETRAWYDGYATGNSGLEKTGYAIRCTVPNQS